MIERRRWVWNAPFIICIKLTSFSPQLMQSQFLGLGGALDYGCLLKPDRAEPHLGDRQALQARIAHLEGQVRLGGRSLFDLRAGFGGGEEVTLFRDVPIPFLSFRYRYLNLSIGRYRVIYRYSI